MCGVRSCLALAKYRSRMWDTSQWVIRVYDVSLRSAWTRLNCRARPVCIRAIVHSLRSLRHWRAHTHTRHIQATHIWLVSRVECKRYSCKLPITFISIDPKLHKDHHSSDALCLFFLFLRLAAIHFTNDSSICGTAAIFSVFAGQAESCSSHFQIVFYQSIRSNLPMKHGI